VVKKDQPLPHAVSGDFGQPKCGEAYHQNVLYRTRGFVDGVAFTERTLFLDGETPWDWFGCEDPRVTYIDGNYYIFYTAIGGYPLTPANIRVAVAVSPDSRSRNGTAPCHPL